MNGNPNTDLKSDSIQLRRMTKVNFNVLSINGMKNDMKNIQIDMNFKADILDKKCKSQLFIKKIQKIIMIIASAILIIINSYAGIEADPHIIVRILLCAIAPIVTMTYLLGEVIVSTSHIIHLRSIKQQLNYCSTLISSLMSEIEDAKYNNSEYINNLPTDPRTTYIKTQQLELNRIITDYVEGYFDKKVQNMIKDRCSIDKSKIKVLKNYMTKETFNDLCNVRTTVVNIDTAHDQMDSPNDGATNITRSPCARKYSVLNNFSAFDKLTTSETILSEKNKNSESDSSESGDNHHKLLKHLPTHMGDEPLNISSKNIINPGINITNDSGAFDIESVNLVSSDRINKEDSESIASTEHPPLNDNTLVKINSDSI